MKLDHPDHLSLARWAADCAEHVLPFFEEQFPRDDRPRKAIEALRAWMRGELKVGPVRAAALAAHAAARAAAGHDPAVFAARAAGQAAGVAHVPTHAGAVPVYSAKAVAAAAGHGAVAKEHAWELRRVPKHLKAIAFPRSVTRLAFKIRVPARTKRENGPR